MIDSSDHRPHHRTNTTTNEKLFICFTSRLSSSSSSMKLSSKSILSPAHSARETTTTPVNSLSTSLSRRLRSNNPTLKGAQSPMFPKKRGSGAAFDINPEPSSPKVTCIGQVRVKTKKKKQIRTLSKRRTTGGEVSFRRFDSKNNREVSNQNQECLRHRNQRWVHLPLTICEGLRAFGAEFSCLFPCRSSCGGERGKEEEEKEKSSSSNSSCGAVFARWLVAVEGGGKGREIELVVGGDDDEEEQEERRRDTVRREGSVLRRHLVEEDIEIGDEKKCDELLKEEEEGRVSICIPPKNALLLMRCRSDPVRMSALANRFWESPPSKCDEEDEEQEQDVEDEACEVVLIGDSKVMEKEEESAEELISSTKENEEENLEEVEENLVMEVQEIEESGNPEENIENNEELKQENEEEKQEEVVVDQKVNIAAEAGENEMFGFLFELLATDTEKLENQLELIQENEAEEFCSEMSIRSEDQVVAVVEEEAEVEELEAALEEDNKSTEEKETLEEKVTQEAETMESEERESEMKEEEKEEREKTSVLPDCLLLMMCEPKLSMEVSKETWVCSTDFIRCLPERPQPVNALDGGDDPKKRVTTDFNAAAAHHHQPPRSSCSLPAPAAVSMAAMIEQKLVNAAAYEPFVLTRCKSEPLRTAAAKLVPESCFWKNRKLEPHRQATFGVGAAGVGF